MDGTEAPTHKSTIRILPDDITECILSQLPVKSLLRFRAVAKSWDATISCVAFGEFHCRQSQKKSASRRLFLWRGRARELHLTEVENNSFKILSVIKYPPEIGMDFGGNVCYCDGLILKCCGYTDDHWMFVLWNPSTRTCLKFQCPHMLNSRYPLYGFWYDPIIKDYKVLLTDLEHYTIFHCRGRYWSEMKVVEERCDVPGGLIDRQGLNLSWMMNCVHDDGNFKAELVYFNIRKEEFSVLFYTGQSNAETICFPDSETGRCSFYVYFDGEDDDQISVTKKAGDDRQSFLMEFNVHLPSSWPWACALWFANEDEIILEVGDLSQPLILYNMKKKTYTAISKPSTTPWIVLLTPFVENLFFSGSTNDTVCYTNNNELHEA